MNVFHTMKLQNRCSYAKLHAKMLFRAMLEIMLIAMHLSKYRHFIRNSKYNWDYKKQFGVIFTPKVPLNVILRPWDSCLNQISIGSF